MKTDTTEIQDGETRFNHIGKGANTAFHIIFILLSILCLAPLVFVIIISFSSEHSVMVNGYSFRPDEWSTGAYEFVFQSGGQVMHSLGMAALVTVTGVAIGMALTSTYAYVLSRKTFRYRKLFTGILVATMFFNGGMISNYILIRGIKLQNTVWSLIIPGCISAFNLILMKNFILQSIPDALEEAARIDGANDLQVLFRIVTPLLKPAIATMIVFCAVNYWNNYFSAMLYVSDRDLWPLTLVLRELVVEDTSAVSSVTQMLTSANRSHPFTLKMAAIIITVLPILIVYPFMQKYFVKGVSLGSVKE